MKFELDKNLKIEDGYKIPPGYFDSFEDRLLAKMHTAPRSTIFLHSKNHWLYNAAAVLILALSIPLLNETFARNTEISTFELENYLLHESTLRNQNVVDATSLEYIDLQNISLELDHEALKEYFLLNTDVEQIITESYENY